MYEYYKFYWIFIIHTDQKKMWEFSLYSFALFAHFTAFFVRHNVHVCIYGTVYFFPL